MAVALAHQEYGNGPPLVILHGLFGSGRNWTGVARKLAQSWRVYAVDLRNHGDSPWHGEMGYRAMAEDVLAFLDRRGLGPVVVVGHSMGGKTAMALSLMHPQRVKSLVVVDIAPVAYGHNFQNHTEAMRALDLSSVSRRSDAEAGLQSIIPNPGIRGFLLQNLTAGQDGFSWRLNLPAIAAGMAAISAFPDALLERAYHGRSLFLGGELSDYVRPEHHETIGRLFPNAEIAEVPDAGHWVHAENPDSFVAHLRSFLEDTPSP